jgi:hypothetical protein
VNYFVIIVFTVIIFAAGFITAGVLGNSAKADLERQVVFWKKKYLAGIKKDTLQTNN